MTIHLPESTVQAAFDVLQSDAHWKGKLVYERTERERKTLLARLEREASREGAKSQRDRETYALTHPHYTALLERLNAAEAMYYEARDKRDSASSIMEAWRTLSADRRAGNVR